MTNSIERSAIGDRRWFRLRVFVAAVALVAGLHGAGVADPDITVTPIARDGQVVVSFDLSDGFTPEVRDAIQSGLSTTFSYEVDLRRGSAWFDKTVASVTI